MEDALGEVWGISKPEERDECQLSNSFDRVCSFLL